MIRSIRTMWALGAVLLACLTVPTCVRADDLPVLRLTPRLRLVTPGVEGSSHPMFALGDVNGDGAADLGVLAVPLGSAVNRLYIDYGGAAMDSFPDIVLKSPRDSVNYGAFLAHGDANGDGVEDLLVGAPSTSLLQPGLLFLYFGPIRGSVAPSLTFVDRGGDPRFGGAGDIAPDLDGDGRPDILATHYASATIGLQYFSGGPSIDTTADVVYLPDPAGLDAVVLRAGNFRLLGLGDVDGDRRGDVAAWTGYLGVSIFRGGQGRLEFLAYSGSYSGVSTVVDLLRGDLNGDGINDVLPRTTECHPGGCSSAISVVQGGTDLRTRFDSGPRTSFPDGCLADFTGDGIPDFLAISNGMPVQLRVGPNIMGATWLPTVGGAQPFRQSVLPLATGDLFHDGTPDVAYFGDVYDVDLPTVNTYTVTAPLTDMTWPVGALRSVAWKGAPLAKLTLRRVSDGVSYVLADSAGGADSNVVQIRIPAMPAGQARLIIAPTQTPAVLDSSDATLTIFADIAMLTITSTPVGVDTVGRVVRWTTNWEVGDLRGFRVERSDDGGVAWQVLASLVAATQVTDPAGLYTTDYRITAIDGWGAEHYLGAYAADGSVLTVSAAPNPFGKGGTSIRVQLSPTVDAVGGSHVDVIDLAGRLVRRLPLATGERHGVELRMFWDGMRDNGSRAPRGIYLLRAENAGRVTFGRVVVGG